jgi:hypothetical protein
VCQPNWYTPKTYNLDKTTNANSVSANVTAGTNDTDNAVNKTPNALNLNGKLAEPAIFGWVIACSL